MDRLTLLDTAESLFNTAGFHVSKKCCARTSCFDFAVRKKEKVAFIKAHPNIGNIYEESAEGLKTVARLFHASPVFVCEKNSNKPLEDDTIYSRYNIGAVTPNTLEDSLLKGMGPLIEAGPGGYYVKLDGKVLRKKRLQKGLSIGKMAEITGVSRRTLYGYERGMAKASVSTAYKLEWILGLPIVKPIDIFQHPQKFDGLLAVARRIIGESRFLQFAVKKLQQLNFSVFQTRRTPFDFIARTAEGKISLLGAVIHEKERDFHARTEEILSISKIVDAQPILITDCREGPDRNGLLHFNDFEKIKCTDDLMAKL
ncbi:MAG: helix-turn-helix domain-containing protein [Candidatus Bathyarchaeota archaeon]|nr:MAG: helix-turn-helix domain-containing protein [Candidatus Bathyarchaeota archaeon]